MKSVTDMRVADLAKERGAAKDDYGKNDHLTTFDYDRPSLMKLTSMVRIDLGCSIDMVEHNLNIIRNV